jgi:hypothetical protein
MKRFSPYRNPKREATRPAAYEPRITEKATTIVTLSKADAGELDRAGHMDAFLRELSEWAERMATLGYAIKAEPEEGPGTMVWRALIG